jgi:predicted protein tyrosine phosphatase
MKILIFNKREFNRFMEFNGVTDENVESKDMLIVSINNAANMGWWDANRDVKSYFKRHHSNVKIMHFPDYGENMALKCIEDGDFSVFNQEKADSLYEFIKQNKDKSLAVLHCGAGVSRSGAVGTFIFDLYGKQTMTYDEFKNKNRRIQPNQYVLKLLTRSLYKDIGLPYDRS